MGYLRMLDISWDINDKGRLRARVCPILTSRLHSAAGSDSSTQPAYNTGIIGSECLSDLHFHPNPIPTLRVEAVESSTTRPQEGNRGFHQDGAKAQGMGRCTKKSGDLASALK